LKINKENCPVTKFVSIYSIKWERKWADCGVENIALQVEHIYPRAKGGSNRIS